MTLEEAIPGTGRILDVWYGGTNHTLADKGAAGAFESIYPDIPHVFRTLRAYKGWMARYIESQGIDQFLVFGAGIPTHGNVHEAVRHARVLYTDIDPLCVEYGQRILANVPTADYTLCDITDLATLDPTVVDTLIDPSQPVGAISVGVSAFLTDDQLGSVLQTLYEWLPTGSYLGIDFDSTGWTHFPPILEIIASAGSPLYLRTPDDIYPLLEGWELVGQGLVPASAMRRGIPGNPTEHAVFMYGAVLRK